MVYDVAVIGAGPAGAAISSLLVKHSFSTIVLEKSRFPRFAIGESLLPQSMTLLNQCGLLKEILPETFQVKEGAIFKKELQTAHIDFSNKFTAGPDTTWQVLRQEFDTILIKAVQRAGAQVFFDTEVKNIHFGNDKVSITCQDKNIESRFVIDASGNALVLPRLMKTFSKPEPSKGKASLFRHFNHDQRNKKESRNILISVHPQNPKIWYWAIPLCHQRVSVGVVGDIEDLQIDTGDIDKTLQELLQQEPNIAKRLQNATPVTDTHYSKNYSHTVSNTHNDQHLVIGNAAGFIDPIFSSGLTIALKSAICGFQQVKKILNGKKANWQEYDQEMKIGNNTFKAYIDAWYDESFQDIIFMENKDQAIQEKINSILAGYAWDTKNPYVREPKRKLTQLHKHITKMN